MTQPFSIGDVLCYQEAANCVLEGEYDFALVYEGLPNCGDRNFSFITEENLGSHLDWLIPGCMVNDRVRNVLTLNSSRLKDDVAKGYARIWPNPSPGKYHLYEILSEILLPHYQTHHGCVLRPRKELLLGARDFMDQHCAYNTILLRRNPWGNNPNRNSNYDAWLGFLRQTKERFILVCAEHEIDERFYLPNVVIAKNERLESDFDCALIYASDRHLGTACGPSIMASFSGIPYASFAQTVIDSPAYVYSDGIGRFAWEVDDQRHIFAPETTERILFEWDRLNTIKSVVNG